MTLQDKEIIAGLRKRGWNDLISEFQRISKAMEAFEAEIRRRDSK